MKEKETITITKEEYLNLLKRDEWLSALEVAGVDNWEGWDFAIDIRDEWSKSSKPLEL